MGNSNSQTVHLRPTGFSLSSKEPRGSRWPQSKYASPANRVLPPPIAGQRLRHTDNGHILQNGGTISGRRLAMLLQQRPTSDDEEDDYAADPGQRNNDRILVQRASMLYGHKKSHSDPDIIRSMIRNRRESESPQPKSVIAVSPSKAKIKSRKKGKAPEPPPQSNTLPRELDRMPLYSRDHLLLVSGGKPHFAPSSNQRTKSPAPLPPGHQRHFAKNKISKSFTDLRSPTGELISISDSARLSVMGRQEPHRKSLGSLEMGVQSRKTPETPKKYAPKPEQQRHSREPPKFQTFQEEIMAAVKRKSQNWSLSASERKKEPEENGRRSPVFSDLCNAEDLKKAWSEEVRKAEDEHHQYNMRQQNKPETPVKQPGERIVVASPSNKFLDGIIPQKEKLKRLGKTYDHEENFANNENLIKTNGQIQAQIRVSRSSNNNNNTNQNNLIRKVQVSQESSSHLKNNNHNSNKNSNITKESSASDAIWTNKNPKQIPDRIENRPSNEIEPPKQSSSIWDRQSYNNKTREDGPQSFQETYGTNHNDTRHPVSSNASTSSSRFSSGSQSEDDEIGATVKPTLPKKMSEMPRFSPTQAWKSLIVVDQPAAPYLSDVSSDDGEVLEERIRQHQRPVAPRRSAVERCADSGISPDAGSPVPVHGRTDAPPARRPGVGRPATPPEPTWTPQQDLEDSDVGSTDMSPQRRSDEQTTHNKSNNFWNESNTPTALLHAKLTLPNGMFPVSRQQELITSALKDKQKRPSKKKKGEGSSQHFNSLRSLKKVLGGLRIKPTDNNSQGLDTNWSLSRSNPAIAQESAPESLGRSPSESALNAKKELERSDSRPLSDGYLMYLPEYDSSFNSQVNEITRHGRVVQTKKKNRFSYQNTVRREAKKLTEEKLSVEVAKKEQQREKEIQWMNKVEEEFRKRREREKINIRYQLKMLTDDDTTDLGDWPTRDVSEREAVSLPYIPMRSPPPETRHLHSYQITNSSTSTSSPDLMTPWPQTTGMSKWLRHQRSTKKSNNVSSRVIVAPPRPEPEGGRSSSDEHRSLENNRRHSSNYHSQEDDLQPMENHIYSSEVKGDYYRDRDTLLSEQMKEAFESHVQYTAHLTDENKVPNKQNIFNSKQIDNGLDKSVDSGIDQASFSRSHPHRNGGRLKSVPLKNNLEKPLLQISPVQPYNPNQAYRPIPFELVLSKGQNNNSGEMYGHSQPIRTAVEAR